MSLFPDDYPTKPHQAKRAPRTCCADQLPPGPHDPRLWHIVHLCSHSRIPFSARTIAAMADVPEDDAFDAIDHAVRLDWLRQVPPETYTLVQIPTWVGQLPRR